MTAQQVIAEEPLKKVRSVFGTRVDLALDLANGLQVILEGRDVVISAEDTKIMLFGEIPAVHIMSFRNGPWYMVHLRTLLAARNHRSRV
jgi:hypothetical protein